MKRFAEILKASVLAVAVAVLLLSSVGKSGAEQKRDIFGFTNGMTLEQVMARASEAKITCGAGGH